MGNLVEIAKFLDPEEAYCAWGFLDANGIYSIIQNHHHLTAAPWLRIALGGYALLALDEEADTAKALLGEVRVDDDIGEPISEESSQAGREKNWFWLPVAFVTETPFLPKKRTGFAGAGQFVILLALYAISAYILLYEVWYWFGV